MSWTGRGGWIKRRGREWAEYKLLLGKGGIFGVLLNVSGGLGLALCIVGGDVKSEKAEEAR